MSHPRNTFVVLLLAAALLPGAVQAQGNSSATTDTSSLRTRLILKDGSFQIVKGYQIRGSIVVYTSAERGEKEEMPTELIDWTATHKWERDHDPEYQAAARNAKREEALQAQLQRERDERAGRAPVVDTELSAEEAARASRTPLVAPDLHLPETGSAFVLDTFHAVPELVPLPQKGGDLNPLDSHSTVKLAVNPLSTAHPVITLKGEGSLYQMHVSQPVFYMRVGNDTGVPSGGTPFTVDTHGAAALKTDGPSGGNANAVYVIERADIRTDARQLSSFSIANVGEKPQTDLIETTIRMLPGGHWMAITPKEPLEFGEYALIEILNERTLNSAVWDFGVHPQRGDNRDSLKPEPKRPASLGRRGSEN